MVHVLLLPGIILALVSAHLLVMFHQKHTQMPGKGRTDRNVVGTPVYPYFMAKTGAFFFLVFAACAGLATFAQINPLTGHVTHLPAPPSAQRVSLSTVCCG
jgi:ubiquinol-cytochrome c reductase cytochrome b subunit